MIVAFLYNLTLIVLEVVKDPFKDFFIACRRRNPWRMARSNCHNLTGARSRQLDSVGSYYSPVVSRSISMALLDPCPQVPQGDRMGRAGGFAHSGMLCNWDTQSWARYLLLQSGSKLVLSWGVSNHMVVKLWSAWPVDQLTRYKNSSLSVDG